MPYCIRGIFGNIYMGGGGGGGAKSPVESSVLRLICTWSQVGGEVGK